MLSTVQETTEDSKVNTTSEQHQVVFPWHGRKSGGSGWSLSIMGPDAEFCAWNNKRFNSEYKIRVASGCFPSTG